MKRLLAVLLLAAVFSFSLTACGKKTVANAGEELKILTLNDLKENSSKEKPIEVVFWHSFGQDITTVVDRLCAQFEAKMAEQEIYIDVIAESTGGGYDGLRSQINMGIKSNAIPTMALGYPDHFADYISNGIMLSLDEFISDSKVGLTAEEKNDYIQSYWAENIFTVDGKESVVGIPFNKSSEVMYYNASVVDPILSGLGLLSENGTWEKPTWTQLFQVSQIIKDKIAAGTLSWTYGNAGNQTADKNAKYPVIIDSSANLFITASHQWGGDGYFTILNEQGEGRVVFNNAKNIEAQNYFLELTKKDLVQLPDKVNESYGSKLMVNNQSFISIGSTAGVKNNNSTKYELKVASYPQISYEESANQAVIQQGTNACILSKNSNNLTRLAAWELIKYLSSPDITADFSISTGYLPVRQSIINQEEGRYHDFLEATDDMFDGAVSQAVNAAFAQREYFYTDVAFNGSSIVRDKVGEAIVSVYCQDYPLTEALKDLYSSLDKLGIKSAEIES